jgi:23S rRNA (uracil1939-C5)-methyltransferase
VSLCRHFGICGGCTFQDKPAEAYLAMRRAEVTEALSRAGLSTEVVPVFAVPPMSRRRATFKALRTETGVLFGFHAARSHDIMDMRECRVLTASLAALVAGLRAMLAEILNPGEGAELQVADTLTGADVSLRWGRKNDATTLAALARWAARLKLARISRHGEPLVELCRPTVRFGKAEVAPPPEAFLQPTLAGEAALQAFVCETLDKARKIADLFCGCGTFSLPLAGFARVHAAELEADHLAALSAAAKQPGLRQVTVEKRNLFKRPLNGPELTAFDGICLDPPRAGAVEQAKALAVSKVKRIAYVSCNAETFARDAAVLTAGGFRLVRVLPVDQFLWSAHVELAAAFVRK